MAKTKLVIKLGSSNTVIYKKNYGVVLREPSLVAVKCGTKQVVEVGIKAKKMQGKTDESISFIEPIFNGEVVNYDICVAMLKAFLSKVLEKKLFNKVEAVFAVPVGLTDNQLMLIKNVAYSCGIDKVRFENVCFLALIGANVAVEKAEGVAVVSLGGGTINFAVCSLNKTIEGFSLTFGGKDIDAEIVNFIRQTKNLEISLQTAEKIKNECGSLYLLDTTNIEISGVDLETKRPVIDIISSSEIREVILPFFEKIELGIEKMLYSCSADIINDITKNGIYFVGGLSKITGLENFFAKKLNMPIVVLDDAENVAVLGGSNL